MRYILQDPEIQAARPAGRPIQAGSILPLNHCNAWLQLVLRTSGVHLGIRY
jgi:hypothetical protein